MMANYVAKYCDDMWTHFNSIRPALAAGARVYYIVGNSTFYGVTVPVERFYAAMLRRAGFDAVACRPIRKRNSNKLLFEYEVSARFHRARP